MKTIRMILMGILLSGHWQVCVGEGENTKALTLDDYREMSHKEVRQFAEQGDADAQYWLGLNYFRGNGVPQNYAESVKWWKLSAQKGGGYSLLNLGRAYAKGRGVQQDSQAAISWWLKGAENGDIYSINELATAYGVGIIVPENNIQAHKWWNISSALGQTLIGEDASERRYEIEKEMTSAQINEAQRLAIEWMEKHPQLTRESE